jgi:hypothetical protein
MSSTHGYSLRAAILPEPWSLQDPSTIVSVTGSIVCGWYLAIVDTLGDDHPPNDAVAERRAM